MFLNKLCTPIYNHKTSVEFLYSAHFDIFNTSTKRPVTLTARNRSVRLQYHFSSFTSQLLWLTNSRQVFLELGHWTMNVFFVLATVF